MIIDIIELSIELKQKQMIIQIFDQEIDLISQVKSVYDNYDYLTIDDIIIEHQINYEKIGVYEVKYILKDFSKNQKIEYFYLVIEDKVLPWITFENIKIKQHDYFNPLVGVEYGDNLDFPQITFFPKHLDTSSPGIKTMTYVITDQRGNYIIEDRKIIVESIDDNLNIFEYLPITLITFIGFISILYIKKKY